MEATLVPMLGTGVLVCTLLLLGLALPTTLREAFLRDKALTGGNMTAERLARVREQLPKAGFKDPAEIERLSTEDSLIEGRTILLSKCVQCHDLRTILARPRTPETWRRTVERMANRSSVLEYIDEDEQLKVTAYLIAISPTLQRSTYLRRQEDMMTARTRRALESTKAMMGGAVPGEGTVDLVAASATFELRCSQCHSPVLVQANPPRSEEAARMLVTRMVRNGLQADEVELEQIISYLVQTYATSQATQPSASTGAAAVGIPMEAGEVDHEIVVRPAGSELRFESPEFEVKRGARLRVVLDNPSASGLTHNFVLVRDADAFDEVSETALSAADRGFVPLHDQLIAGIAAQPAGSQGAVELIAPEPGRYRFGCTMPGHSFTMRGTLVVTE